MENKKDNKDTSKEPKYKLEDLLKNCNKDNRHEEMIADKQGKELI